MCMERQKTRKQHYVPRFYLNGFCNSENFLYVYDKELDKYRESVPNNICFQNDLYELGTLEFEEKVTIFTNKIEDLYCRNEGKFASCINSVISKLNSQISSNAVIMSIEETQSIMDFINNLIVRNPYTMKISLENENNKKRVVDIFKKNAGYPVLTEMFGETYSHNVDKFIQAVFKDLYLNPETYDENGAGYINCIRDMSFVFLKSKSVKFITSDFPISIEVNEENNSFKKLYFPISPYYAINFFDEKTKDRNRIRFLDDKEVIHLNAYCVSNYMSRFVFSNSKENLIEAVEYAKGNKKFE